MEILASISDWFSWGSVSGVFKWSVVITLLVGGFIGSFIPILPGTTIIYAGVVAHWFMFGEESGMGWAGLAIQTALWVITLLLDWVSGLVGAKWFGSSRWGVIGALIGGLVGMFFSIPGLIIGPIVGVFVAEIFFARRTVRPAARSTFGTAVGGLAGMLAKIVIAAVMIIWYVLDVFFIDQI